MPIRPPKRLHSRRLPLLAAALLVGASALSACGGSGADGSKDPLAGVTVTGGDAKTAPKVAVKTTPLSVKETATRVIRPGSGAELKGDEIVSLNFVLLNGKDGSQIESTYGKGSSGGLNLANQGLLPGLKKGLAKQRIGSQILLGIPPKDAFGTNGNPQLKVGGTDTLLFVMDLVSATKPLASAQGTPVKPVAGLPTVKMVEGQPAVITMPKKPAPKKTVAQLLVEGTGPEVKSGSTIRVSYTGALWKNGKVFDSSAQHPEKYFETVIGQKQVINAWDAKLVGQKVGSRVLLVVPPADGYGAAGQPSAGITGSDTLVFVIDILATY
ncbi:MAG TPA: FKBP-type peptidyl-prolyl cis-trans isomerase [Dermatophilaceae bacterium]|nr:FKBP-type peptidyl-prolyl cis-trans isomerase [Dermatophilaceae bacterium]